MGGFGLVSEYLRVLYIVLMICLLTGQEPTANFGNQCNLQIS